MNRKGFKKMSVRRFEISATRKQVATSKGTRNSYGFDIIDMKTKQIVDSAEFSNEAEAKAYYEEQKKILDQKGGATVNGEVDNDPFSGGGEFASTSDFEFGGFATDQDRDLEMDKEDKLITEDDLADYAAVSNKKAGRAAKATTKLKVEAFDLCGLSEDDKKNIYTFSTAELHERGKSGVFGQCRIQPRVDRVMLSCEKLVSRGVDNNAFIIIGNDRVDKPHTGTGGQGHTKSDMIDLCVGLGGYCTPEVEMTLVEDAVTGQSKMVEKPAKVNPNFYLDAARIYISQKTHVDKNFGIGPFGATEKRKEDNSKDENYGKYGGKSAVAIKADNVRVIGRESIKIVTGTDLFNSKGGTVYGKSGIKLIAMNKEEQLQPMVLGDNLLVALNILLDSIEAIGKIFHGYVKYQMKFNNVLQNHTHNSPFFTRPVTVSDAARSAGVQINIESAAKTELSILKHITNIQGIRTNYLTPSGGSFINSELNEVN